MAAETQQRWGSGADRAAGRVEFIIRGRAAFSPQRHALMTGRAAQLVVRCLTDRAGATLTLGEVNIASAAHGKALVVSIGTVMAAGVAAGQQPSSGRPGRKAIDRADGMSTQLTRRGPRGAPVQQPADLYHRGDADADPRPCARNVGAAAPCTRPRAAPLRRRERKHIGPARAAVLAVGSPAGGIVVRQRSCAHSRWKEGLWCRWYCRGRRTDCQVTSRAR